MKDWRLIRDEVPDGRHLYREGYIPDVVLLRSDSAGMIVWPMESGFFWFGSQNKHYTHWMPIPRLAQCGTELVAEECTPLIVNVTFGDVHIAEEVDAEEFQARVIAAVRRGLGQDDKEQLLQNPDCRVCRHYAENCSARWLSGQRYGRHGCYEPKPEKQSGSAS